MSVSYADNAVLAKAHAMYGKRITKENYTDMLNCKSLNELAAYLKTRTYFSADFEALPANINSAQIEELLKMSVAAKKMAVINSNERIFRALKQLAKK